MGLILPGGASTAKMVQCDGMKEAGPRAHHQRLRAVRVGDEQGGSGRGAEIRHNPGRGLDVRQRTAVQAKTESDAERGAAAVSAPLGGDAQTPWISWVVDHIKSLGSPARPR